MSYLFQRLPYVVPELIICGLGIMKALQYMTRAPRAATFALWGFIVLAADEAFTTVFFGILINNPGRGMSGYLTVVSLIGDLAHVAGMALVLAAVFAERGTAPAASGSLADRVGKTCVSCGERGAMAARFCANCGAAFANAG
jgi:hypothetical protein